MSELKFPNETVEYRAARDALLEDEKALIAQIKAIAEKRRQLPLGGKLKEDYVFSGASESSLERPVKLSELFGDKKTLILYSLMFGPNWDKPCPSCTSIVDGFDRLAHSVEQTTAFSVVAKAPAAKLNAWATERGWTNVNLLSAEKNEYLIDYLGQDNESDKTLWPMINVFTKADGAIHHFWGAEMKGNSIDMVWAYWNLMDMTPEGRPDLMTPPQDFRSTFLEKHYLGQ